MTMLYLFLGTDRMAARAEAAHRADTQWKDRDRVIISDAHTIDDLGASLQGGGLFGTSHVVILDSVFANEGMRERLIDALPHLQSSADIFFVIEEKLDAATKRLVGKYAHETQQFDAQKAAVRDNSSFALAGALRRGDKKALWVGLMREYADEKPPEMIHGLLFWAAKQELLGARQGTKQYERAVRLVAELAELPHEARRSGFDLEYALEAFTLSLV